MFPFMIHLPETLVPSFISYDPKNSKVLLKKYELLAQFVPTKKGDWAHIHGEISKYRCIRDVVISNPRFPIPESQV